MTSVKLHIARHDPETKTSGWSDFNVELREKTTVLDCLDRIQHSDDPSLGFRYACRVGMCGSCAMVVNGKDRWTCRTLVRDLGAEEITLEPLRNMPVIRDLAVDFKPLWEKYREIKPAFEQAPAGARPLMKAQARRQRDLIAPNMQCISCGACYSACGYVKTDPLYLGPHALNRAFTIIEDPRDGSREARLDIVDNEHGCWKCHVQTQCTQVCPMELSPSAGIQHLKRAVLQRRVLTPERRKFVFAALGAAVTAVAAFALYESLEWATVAPVDSIPTDSYFDFPYNGRYAFLQRSAGGDVQAFSQRCSHQGCRVKWSTLSNEFQCPCHKGMFDPVGRPTFGPPVRPLERYLTRIVNGNVEVFL